MVSKAEALKPTLWMTVFSVVNYALAFALQIFTAKNFGNGVERDNYLIALTIPTYIMAVLSVIPSVFLPIFVDVNKASTDDGYKFVSSSLSLSAVGLIAIGLLGGLFASTWVGWIAPSISTHSLEMSSLMLRITIPAVLFLFLANLLSSLYYAQYRFIQPALAPVFNTLTSLVFILVGNRYLGIYSLPIGFLAGSFVSFMVVSPTLTKIRFSIDLENPGLRNLVRTVRPLILAALIFQLTSVFQKWAASTLPAGSISSFGYAIQLVSVLSNLLSGAIISLLFPLMSNAWSEGRMDTVRSYLLRGIGAILMVTLPFASILYFWSKPLTSFIFERGTFTSLDTLIVANTISLLSAYFVFVSLGGLVAKVYYFSGKTKAVAIQETVILVIYLILGYVWVQNWQLRGLAIASSVTTGLSILSSYIIVGRIMQGFDYKSSIVSSLQILLAVIMAFGLANLGQMFFDINVNNLFWLSFVVASGMVIYIILLLFVFKLRDAVLIYSYFVEWLKKHIL